MDPGYIIISLDSLIKQDDVSICLLATRRGGISEEGAWHGVSAHKCLSGDGKAFMHKA